MARLSVFQSYSRQDAEVATSIAADLNDAGVEVWRDQRLAGGQEWWDAILEQIRAADVVLFVVSDSSLDSVPCARELGYAEALGKPIIPVRVDRRTSPRVSPPLLASKEWVDYMSGDKAAALQLLRALNSLPPPAPLPTPLPPDPEVPLSYTTNLAASVHQAEELLPAEQHTLLFQLREGLDKPGDREECLGLLRKLQDRREMLASVAREIDRILKEEEQVRTPRAATAAPTAPDSRARQQQRPVGVAAGTRPGPPGAGAGAGGWSRGPAPVGSARVGPQPPFVSRPGPGIGSWPAPPPGAPPGRGSRKALWWTLGILGGLFALLAGLAIMGALAGPNLDAVRADCSQGDLAACDTLFLEAPVGSDDEAYGANCGEYGIELPGSCAADLPQLDTLRADCEAGDPDACDQLYMEAPPGSDYETFGATCGDRLAVPAMGTCAPQ
jgi:hypothetical protein